MRLNHVNKLTQVPRSGLNNSLVHIKGSIVALITDNNAIFFYEYRHDDRALHLRDQIVFSSPLIEIESLALSTDEQWLIIATSSALTTLTDSARPTVHVYKVLDLTRSLNDTASRAMFSAVTCFSVYFQPKTVAATPIDNSELLLAVGGGNGVELFRCSLPDMHVTPQRLLHDATSISHVTFDASGHYLGIVAADGHVGVWSRDNLLSTGHIDWFDHVTSERVTDLQFNRDAQRPQLALSTWDGQLFVYAREGHAGTWQHVALNLLLTHPEKNTNNPGGFIQFAGRYLVTCLHDQIVLSDTCQNAIHNTSRVPLKDVTDCIKGLVLVDVNAVTRVTLVLTRSRDLYCLTLPLPLSISGKNSCIAKHADTALYLHHTADWRHAPLQLSVRTAERHVSFECPHVSYEMLGSAVTCAVTSSHVCLAVGAHLLLYSTANDTWRDIFTEKNALAVCFINDHVVALLDTHTLVTWQLSTGTQRSTLKIGTVQARDTFLLSHKDQCCVVRWDNDTCHLQFLTLADTGLKAHSQVQYDHVIEVRYTESALQMTRVNGETVPVAWP